MLPVRTGAGEPGARQSKNPFHTSLKVAMYIYKNYDNPTLLNKNCQINLQVLLLLLTFLSRTKKGDKNLSSSILKMNVRHGESQRRRGKDEVLDIAQSGGWALLNPTIHFAISIKSVNQQNNE